MNNEINNALEIMNNFSKQLESAAHRSDYEKLKENYNKSVMEYNKLMHEYNKSIVQNNSRLSISVGNNRRYYLESYPPRDIIYMNGEFVSRDDYVKGGCSRQGSRGTDGENPKEELHEKKFSFSINIPWVYIAIGGLLALLIFR